MAKDVTWFCILGVGIQNGLYRMLGSRSKAYPVQAELSDINAVQRMLDEISEKDIHMDIVFNNAAVQIAYRHEFFKTPVEDFTKVFLLIRLHQL